MIEMSSAASTKPEVDTTTTSRLDSQRALYLLQACHTDTYRWSPTRWATDRHVKRRCIGSMIITSDDQSIRGIIPSHSHF